MSIKFNKSDFSEIKFFIVLMNETSGTECRKHRSIKIAEVTMEGMSLLVPVNVCQQSHSLTVLFFKGPRPKIPDKIPVSRQGEGIYFSALGKVMEKNDDENDLALIKLKFTQFDKFGWEDIVNLYAKRKKAVSDHINRLKVRDED